jgi:hypothetical protein
LSPDGPRPMVSESKWWDVLEGEYNQAVEHVFHDLF